MDSAFLTLRLSDDDARTVEALRAATGLSKTDLVRQALRLMARTRATAVDREVSLYDLRKAQAVHPGDASRQSSDVKRIVRERVRAKQR